MYIFHGQSKSVNNMGYVYEIRHIPSNLAYVGASKQPGYSRLGDHIRLLKNGQHWSKEFQQAWDNDLPNWVFRILEECENKNLRTRERYWIKLRKGTVNVARPREITRERRKEIREAIASGKTYRQVAEEFGVARGTVGKAVHET